VFNDHDEDNDRVIMNNYKEGLLDAWEEISNFILSGDLTGLNNSNATAVSLYARFLKRIASHSRNIVTSVVNPLHRIGYRVKQSTRSLNPYPS
jgi:phosphate uptake regulator